MNQPPNPPPSLIEAARDLMSIWRGRSDYRMRAAKKRLAEYREVAGVEDRAIAETWATAANELEHVLMVTTAANPTAGGAG